MIIDTDRHISIKDFSKIIGKSPESLLYYVKSGQVLGLMIGRCWFIDKKEIKRWPPKPKKIGRPIKASRTK